MSVFDNLRVSTKLILGFGVCLLLTLISTIAAISRMSVMNERTNTIVTQAQAETVIAANLTGDFRQYRVQQFRSVIALDPKMVEERIQSMNERKAEVAADLQAYDKIATDSTDRANLAAFNTAWQQALALEPAITAATRAHNAAACNKLINYQAEPFFAAAREAVTSMIKWNTTRAQQLAADAAGTYRMARNIMIVLLIAAIVIGFLVAWLITHTVTSLLAGVTKSVMDLRETFVSLAANLQSMGNGDLTPKAIKHTQSLNWSRKDEFGDLARVFDEMIGAGKDATVGLTETQRSLGNVIGQAETAARAISESSAQLASGMQQFADGNLGVNIESNSARVEIDGKGDFAALAASFSNIYDSNDHITNEFQNAQRSLSTLVGQANAAAKGISVSSADLASCMESLAEGDLTASLPPRADQVNIASKGDFASLADSFNTIYDGTATMADAFIAARSSLSELIGHALGASEAIAAASTQLASGNEDLSARTAEQASSLEETAASMEQMTSIVKQNAENALHANDVATHSRSLALAGGEVVAQAVEAMRGINESSKHISDIISVIDEIAFQTNLLALNAAVEAARVGEQGRGFAVVASEVRNLAGRSSTAAKEIKALVKDSVNKVESGSELVNKSGEQLRQIVESGNTVAEIVSAICAASQEQAAGIDQVNKAVLQMDEITQQNAALVEEAASSSEEMSAQAHELRDLVRKFKVDERLLGAALATAPAKPVEKRGVRAPKPRTGSSHAATLKVVGGGAVTRTMDEF
ncbi:MAG: methyl-accepting chemotaxis protein [Capsulimonadaceae bacterium]|nr:methyl-accepting chemotaxis protein [Capsulimonadaceae bacterium]